MAAILSQPHCQFCETTAVPKTTSQFHCVLNFFIFISFFFAHAQLFLCNPTIQETTYQEIFTGPTSEIFIFQYWLYMI